MESHWRCFLRQTPEPKRLKRPSSCARYATRRHQLIAFQNSFHGRTMGALSLTASKPVQRKGFGPLLAGCDAYPLPESVSVPFGCKAGNGGRGRAGISGRCRVSNDRCSRRSCCHCRRGRSREKADYVIPPANFLKGLAGDRAQLRNPHRLPMRFRAEWDAPGKMFAFEHFDCRPDIIAIAKGIASGSAAGRHDGPGGPDDVGARRSRVDVRRKSRESGGCAGNSPLAPGKSMSRTPRKSARS